MDLIGGKLAKPQIPEIPTIGWRYRAPLTMTRGYIVPQTVYSGLALTLDHSMKSIW